MSADDANAIAAAAQRAFSMKQVRAGNTVIVSRTPEGKLHEIDYKIDPDRMLEIVPTDHGFFAEVKPIPSKTEVATVAGEIDGSLFNAVAQAGESPELTLDLAKIFSYDLDFYTDPRRGDTFRVVLEKKKYAVGKTAGYGKTSGRRVQQRRETLSGSAVSRRNRAAWLLHGRGQGLAENFPAVAAEICRARDLAFQ